MSANPKIQAHVLQIQTILTQKAVQQQKLVRLFSGGKTELFSARAALSTSRVSDAAELEAVEAAPQRR